jgi:hypothetical protein
MFTARTGSALFALLLLPMSASVISEQGMTLSVRTPTTARAHEPIEMTFVLENLTAEEARVDLGWNRLGAFIFTVTGPDGTARIVRHRSPSFGGISAHPEVVVGARQIYRGWVLLNELTDLSTPGRYHVSIRSEAAITGSAALKATVLEGTWETVLQISPTTEADIRSLCERLLRESGDLTVVADAQRSAAALASIRHRVAVPYLEAAARIGWGSIAVPALGRISDPLATSALQTLSELEGDTGALAAGQLRRGSPTAP